MIWKIYIKMTKSITTVSLDSDVLEIARSRNINLSGVINEYLDQYLNMGEFKVSDIKKLESEIGEKTAELNALKAHLNVLKREEEKIPEPTEESKVEKLKNAHSELLYEKKGIKSKN